MMKNVILNKWFIHAVVILIGLISVHLIKPIALNKFKGEIFNSTFETIADGQRIEYIDVDFDHNSEEFIYYHLSDNRHPIINQYSSKGEFQNAWYLEGEVAENFDFIYGDYNNDSIQEVFVFSFFNNSLCLHGIVPGKSNEFLVDKKIIYSFSGNTDSRHFVIHSGGIADFNNDGWGDILFSVNSRYIAKPRAIFIYDIFNDSIIQSENFRMQLVGKPIIYDINNDNFPEVFLSTLNNTNQGWMLPQKQTKHSSSIVLNNKLEKVFEPVLYENQISVTSTFPVLNESQNHIGCLSWPLRNNKPSKLLMLDLEGNIVKQKKLANDNFLFDPIRTDWSRILLFNKKGLISEYNNDMDITKNINMQNPVNQVAFIDIDHDKKEEILVVQNNSLTIFRDDFNYPVKIDIPGLSVKKVNFSIDYNIDEGNKLSVQNNNQHYIIKYYKNSFYWVQYFKYLISILICYSVYLFFRGIYYKKVNQIKYENEKFYKMQMELIRNQLDPHFLFNALNSISFSINKDERKTAYVNIGLFSKFLRESIVSVDEFSRSLEEEINYVKNYLLLEKFRFKEKFNYDFITGPGVNLSIKVPKLILFSFIESALKKGVLPKSSGGRIEITIDSLKNKDICIIVSDTGLFRNIESKGKSHTKNMLMIERIISYFNKFNRTKINITYFDLGTKHDAKGSRIEIIVPHDYRYMV